MTTKTLIIGSGPAGYTAAIYASRANLSPILYEGLQPGGQLTTTTEVENFPGHPEGVDGPELMIKMQEQARRFGADLRPGRITSVDFSSYPLKAIDDNGETIEAETVIIATGALARYLGIPGEARFQGMGVSACATCDGFFYRGRKVAVVGGGDTACEEALYLSGIAEHVSLIVRKDRLRASKLMQQRLNEKENITIYYNTQTVDLYGDEVLETARLVEHKGTDKERIFDIPVDGFFLAIGHDPNTELFKGQINLDPQGFIITYDGTQRTSVSGVFAAGDVADPHYQQAITAAATGCRAALDAEHFLMNQQ
ncbi:MAG: thioredoxin-disulfide reductase [Muribaculum sp.]|nr:thioredoxin-disulfide reductase [Muribaculum sp.]